MNVPDDVADARERTITAHLDGETRKDVGSVLATFGGEPTYELVSIDTVIRGADRVGRFLQTFFDTTGPATHLAERFHHAEGATVAELVTIFPDGMDGQQPGEDLRVHAVAIFPFDGDQLLAERLYADMTPLLPFLDFLD